MKTLVASYPDFETARAAVDELVEARFERSQISIIAADADGRFSEYPAGELAVGGADAGVEPDGSDVASGAGIGAAIGGIGGLLLGLAVLPIPGVGPVLAAGPIAAALAGAGLGAAAGGLLGALTELGVSEEEAGAYAESVRRGDVLVTATVPDVSADQADRILERAGRADMAERTAEWRAAGWSGFATAGDDSGEADDEARAEELAQRDAARHTGAVPHPVAGHGAALPALADDTDEMDVVVATPADAFVAAPPDSPAGVARAYAAAELADASDTAGDVSDDVVGAETENDWRADHAQRYSADGEPYSMYRRAYFYGYQLAQDPRYQGRAWGDVEADVVQDWEARSYGPWARFKDAVRHAWERVGD